VKYGNGTFAFLVTLFVIPLTQFAFTWEFLQLEGKLESVSWFSIVILVLMLIGISLFRICDKSVHLAKTQTETVEMMNVHDILEEDESTLHVASLPTYFTFFLHLFSTHLPPQLGVVTNHYWTFP